MYLYFQPQGGFNDILSGIYKNLAYSKKYGRILLIDMRNSVYHINFSDYFVLPYENVIYNMATIEKICENKGLSVYPEILSSRLEDVVKGHCKFIYTVDGYSYKDHIFKLPTEPRAEAVLIHIRSGGGPDGYRLFKDLQFTKTVKDICIKRYKLLEKPYLCIQIRNTDRTCDYEDLYKTAKHTFASYKSIYVATDNPIVLEFFAKNNVAVHNYTTFSKNKNPLNLHKSSVDPHTKITDMLSDIYLCAMADELLSNSIGGYINLIRKCRENKKHTEQQFA